MKPILFLDVDGVLNRCGKSAQGLESDKVELLRWIVERTDCEIVVTSTWRKIDRCRDRLTALNLPIIGWTPDLDREDIVPANERSKRLRGTEIGMWLIDNFETDQFCILDDDMDMGDLLPHLVKTDSFTGLTPEIASEVVRRLKKPALEPLNHPG